MIKSMRAVLLLLLVVSAFVVPAVSAAAQGNSRTFPETGKTVRGAFLQYWNNHGGLAQQGYPISDEMQEVSPSDGAIYTVQYFERAVFESHPENKAPYDVLLSLLGDFRYKQKYPNGAPGQVANQSAGSKFFPETGKTVGGSFLQYWNEHGGLAQQGYPISDEFQEVSDLDGKTYTVQYFERAVFEYHPENSAPNDVLLSQLGKFRHDLLDKPGARLLGAFEQVWWLVQNNYVYPDYRGLDWKALHSEYAAKIEASGDDATAYGLINELTLKLNDQHTQFQTPEQVKEDDAMRNGDLKLVGIGVSIQELDGGQRIVYVVPGSPAERAGLHLFDVIVAVDGVKLADTPDAITRIRGSAGTPVTITVQTPGQDPRDVTIIREEITFAYHATASRLPGTNIALLNMPTFNVFGIADEAGKALEKLLASGPLDGVIIDVRLNGGGLINEELQLTSRFIDGGIGGYSAGRYVKEIDHIPAGNTIRALNGKPVVILTSAACVSACEHFSVSMHDLKRATVLGTATAGNTETLFPHMLIDGSRLLLAERTFLRPDGSSIEDKGLQPDVVLDVPWYQYAPTDDPQIKAASGLITGQ